MVSIQDGCYTVTAMKETLLRSNLDLLKEGDRVNVERSMPMNGRLDGHIVQGHVDQTARCVKMEDAAGSTYFTFEYALDREMTRKGYFTVDKGSVTVNGISLTVINPTDNTFTVAIIPCTPISPTSSWARRSTSSLISWASISPDSTTSHKRSSKESPRSSERQGKSAIKRPSVQVHELAVKNFPS